MNYKGYAARLEYSEEDGLFVGHIAGIRDVVGFHGSSVEELRAAFVEAVDDYLKAILELSGPVEARVTSNALAERLGVRAASVTGMLQKLASQRPPLVLYEKHRGARLSLAGKRRAWEIVRHHRLLELFLHDVLRYSWDEVHEEAERLEHFISERFEDRLAAILGDPQIDPHGHAIPQKYGAGSFSPEVPLLKWPRPRLRNPIKDTKSL